MNKIWLCSTCDYFIGYSKCHFSRGRVNDSSVPWPAERKDCTRYRPIPPARDDNDFAVPDDKPWGFTPRKATL